MFSRRFERLRKTSTASSETLTRCVSSVYDRRVVSGRVGSDRVVSGRVGSGQVGSCWVGLGRVVSDYL